MGKLKRFEKRITIRLSEEQYNNICKVANNEGMTLNAYMRVAGNYLAKKLKNVYGQPPERPDMRMNFKWY